MQNDVVVMIHDDVGHSSSPVTEVPPIVDDVVPLLPDAPSWLMLTWATSFLLKLEGLPLWPCRIGSSTDLEMFPAASRGLRRSDKQVFVFTYGDHQVMWSKYKQLKPWPDQSEQEVVLQQEMSSELRPLLQQAFDEAVAWNTRLASVPFTSAPVVESRASPERKRRKKRAAKVKPRDNLFQPVVIAKREVHEEDVIAVEVDDDEDEHHRDISSRMPAVHSYDEWMDVDDGDGYGGDIVVPPPNPIPPPPPSLAASGYAGSRQPAKRAQVTGMPQVDADAKANKVKLKIKMKSRPAVAEAGLEERLDVPQHPPGDLYARIKQLEHEKKQLLEQVAQWKAIAMTRPMSRAHQRAPATAVEFLLDALEARKQGQGQGPT